MTWLVRPDDARFKQLWAFYEASGLNKIVQHHLLKKTSLTWRRLRLYATDCYQGWHWGLSSWQNHWIITFITWGSPMVQFVRPDDTKFRRFGSETLDPPISVKKLWAFYVASVLSRILQRHLLKKANVWKRLRLYATDCYQGCHRGSLS